jgi:hypothetical protein
MDKRRIVVALTYAVGISVAAFQAAATPITVEGWIGLGVTFVGAFWAKYSSEQTVLAANRVVWSAEQRKVEGEK